MAIFEIKNLSFTYKGALKKSLNNINLSFNEGDIISISGATGCGKTTLLKLLKKQLRPNGEVSGSVKYLNQEISELDDKISSTDIGFVSQNPELQIVTDTVSHELAFGLENMGVSPPEIRRRVAEVSSYFGISDLYSKNIDLLSGGQKQLINLASVMVMNPRILIFDEPTAQLDPISAGKLIQMIKKINEEIGTTIIIVEHRLEEIIPISDQIIIINDGSIIFDGSKECLVNSGDLLSEMQIINLMPASYQIFHGLKIEKKLPLTINEGRKVLRENFSNIIQALEEDSKRPFHNQIININDGFFRYSIEGKDILNGLDLIVYQNEFLCVLGDNGVGKSTLINIIAGISFLYSGKISIAGSKRRRKKRLVNNIKIALLPQNPISLFIKESVRKEFESLMSSMITKQDIDEIIDFLDLSNILDLHPYDLSGGELQKTAIGKLLLTRPDLLLLDEPTKGLDANSKEKLAKYLKSLQDKGMTLVVASHDIEFAAKFSDRVALYFDGKIVAIDDKISFFSNNSYYTTAAKRLSFPYYIDTTTIERVIKLGKINGAKNE